MANFRCRDMETGSILAQMSTKDTTEDHIFMGTPKRGGDEASPDGSSNVMLAEPKVQTKRPPMYKVILLNDDYTPMDFVVMVLEQIFKKSHQDSLQVMLEVHQKGAGIAGIFTRDVAETKADMVVEYARINDYPLQCTLESE